MSFVGFKSAAAGVSNPAELDQLMQFFQDAATNAAGFWTAGLRCSGGYPTDSHDLCEPSFTPYGRDFIQRIELSGQKS